MSLSKWYKRVKDNSNLFNLNYATNYMTRYFLADPVSGLDDMSKVLDRRYQDGDLDGKKSLKLYNSIYEKLVDMGYTGKNSPTSINRIALAFLDSHISKGENFSHNQVYAEMSSQKVYYMERLKDLLDKEFTGAE
ncbi:MAG: hypothetical protein ACTSU6_04840 [Candidatus Njordarchaeales archaeon]